MNGFVREDHSLGGPTRAVYKQGSGPGVLVIHEVPGIHPDVVTYAEELVAAGFTVWMPELFGVVGKQAGPIYTLRELGRACLSSSFSAWRTGENSPIVEEMRELSRLLSLETKGSVGAVGMCLTGGFALAMMVDPWVTAPVLSQPSLPLGVFPWQRRDLGVDGPTLAQIKHRIEEGVCVLGLRYKADPSCPAARFETLRRELGDGFEGIELPGWRPRHSVLTLDRDEESVQRTIRFFREHTGKPLTRS